MCGMEADGSFTSLAKTYLDACMAEGKSPKTLLAYKETLDWYLRIAQAEGLPLEVSQVRPADVYRYLAAVRRRGVSAATQHRRHREVKHFFSWLKRLQLVADNPFQKVPLIRLQQRIIQPFTADDIARLLRVLRRDTCLGSRDAALSVFLLDTGTRASEAVALDLSDVDLQQGRARILQGKGNKQRIVAFGPEVATHIAHYLCFRGLQPGPLFQTKQRRRLRAHGLAVIYQRLGQRAGVLGAHPHRFRAPAGAQHVGDGAALYADLRRGAGGSGPRELQSGGAAEPSSGLASPEPPFSLRFP